MATSSIFTTVKITNPQKAEMFFSALDSSIQQQQQMPQRSSTVHVTSTREEIASLMAKRKKND